MIKWKDDYVREKMTADSEHGALENPVAFESLELAFLGSLIPGIIHNFATPLSGVIGATQLLETRVEAIEQGLENAARGNSGAWDEARNQLQRQRTNLDILTRNAQHLADLLQTLVHRINRASVSSPDYHSLSELVAAEVRFLDANLHFKHKVKKHLDLSKDLPAVPFVYAYVVGAIEEFASLAILKHDATAGTMDMTFTTCLSGTDVQFVIAATLPASRQEEITADILQLQCARLREDGWATSYEFADRSLQLTLSRPATQQR